MPPAARSTDPTAHGTPLSGPGSPDVLIEGLPAYRALTDFHSCPVTDTSGPHVGGVVNVGSGTVFINNVPAVRQGDVIVEGGPPNSIVGGAPSVQIG